MIKIWKPVKLPNGIWEVSECNYYFNNTTNNMEISSYSTIVRDVTQEQAVTIAKEHNRAIDDH